MSQDFRILFERELTQIKVKVSYYLRPTCQVYIVMNTNSYRTKIEVLIPPFEVFTKLQRISTWSLSAT